LPFRSDRVRLACMNIVSLHNPPGDFVIYGVVVRN
jgi:hypothetical protein